MRRGALVCCLLLSLTGCTAQMDFSTVGGLPRCTNTSEKISRGLVLMAQSVPSATWLPCVGTVPVGWDFNDLDARDGIAKITFHSDREGSQPLTVVLSATCSVRGATETPSERSGMRRYERDTRSTGGYGGQRYYVFPGGCITYRFDLRGESRDLPVEEISKALGVVNRAVVREWVHNHVDGRDLDARPTAAQR